jgi:hypothetical protein
VRSVASRSSVQSPLTLVPEYSNAMGSGPSLKSTTGEIAPPKSTLIWSAVALNEMVRWP